ncbi:MAG: hypothetical protein M1826_003249 [Phylliscum demangeonii]|nr:MAG: hypothetical protein M1826_003249 [Phylliscum demangeonii]
MESDERQEQLKRLDLSPEDRELVHEALVEGKRMTVPDILAIWRLPPTTNIVACSSIHIRQQHAKEFRHETDEDLFLLIEGLLVKDRCYPEPQEFVHG